MQFPQDSQARSRDGTAGLELQKKTAYVDIYVTSNLFLRVPYLNKAILDHFGFGC